MKWPEIWCVDMSWPSSELIRFWLWSVDFLPNLDTFLNLWNGSNVVFAIIILKIIGKNSHKHCQGAAEAFFWCSALSCLINTLRPRWDGRHFPDDNFKSTFLNEDVWILIKISLNFVSKGQISNIPALVQIMAWRRSGDKPLSEPMMVSLLTHLCVTRPQWVNW